MVLLNGTVLASTASASATSATGTCLKQEEESYLRKLKEINDGVKSLKLKQISYFLQAAFITRLFAGFIS